MKSLSLGVALGMSLIGLGKGATGTSPVLKWTNRPTGPWLCPPVGKAGNVFSADDILQMIAADTYLWGCNQTENWSGLVFPEGVPTKSIEGFQSKELPELCTKGNALPAYPIMIVDDDTDSSKPGPYRVLISHAYATKHTKEGEVHEYAFCALVAIPDDAKKGYYKMCSPEKAAKERDYGIKDIAFDILKDMAGNVLNH